MFPGHRGPDGVHIARNGGDDEHAHHEEWRDDLLRLSLKLVRNATLKLYPVAPHGMCTTEKHEVNADLLAFIKASPTGCRGPGYSAALAAD